MSHAEIKNYVNSNFGKPLSVELDATLTQVSGQEVFSVEFVCNFSGNIETCKVWLNNGQIYGEF